MSDHKRHTTITPAPVPRTQPATIGDAMELDAQHSAECSVERRRECELRDHERADKDGIFWARIVAAEATLKSMHDGLNFAKWAIPIIITILLSVGGTVGIYIAKYAIVGAITMELDKRIPPGLHLNLDTAADRPHYAVIPPTAKVVVLPTP
jgi:hypothetical protein